MRSKQFYEENLNYNNLQCIIIIILSYLNVCVYNYYCHSHCPWISCLVCDAP